MIGFNLLQHVQTTYNAFFFVTLKPWDERTAPDEQYAALKANINEKLAGIPEGIAFSFPPPAIPGIGTSGGVTFMLEDRAGRDLAFLAENLNTFIEAARKRPEIARHQHVPARRAAGLRRTSIATRCSSRASTSPRSARRCRPSWAVTS